MSAILCWVAVSKTRAFLRTQKLCRMWIESNDDRCPARFLRMARRGRNNRLMTEMDPVENADREKDRPGNLRQLRDRPQDAHELLVVRRRASARLPAGSGFSREYPPDRRS